MTADIAWSGQADKAIQFPLSSWGILKVLKICLCLTGSDEESTSEDEEDIQVLKRF